ncbi:hypothetical protein QO010_001792 [Caulobacter ginsengisoli]|uniref:PhnA-like protein n=1 Tax=Caulobacter ginsengisoli TaxID=400775 RepID=A0ABU0IPT2_9CAUL|nr:hypothetical protein [Caulobacter ginsengisoli]MDQ0464021.1 hypothetical protein [Caulobacter ginsengisoli]
MADLDFEMRLDRLFAEPPHLADSEAFAHRVETRLNRGWSLRSLAIGAAGVLGGVIGAGQLISSNLLGQAQAASVNQTNAISDGFSNIVKAGSNLSALPIGGEAVWLVAALGILALAFGITRAMDEI